MKNILYIHYYHKNISNRLLVIGFLRGIFKFKYFYYINLKNYNHGDIYILSTYYGYGQGKS